MLWGEPGLLHALWLVPILLVLAILAAWSRRRRLREWVELHLLSRMAPARAPVRRGVRNVLFVVAVAFAVLAAARPQVGARTVQVDRRGIDVLIALDVSLSMEAEDVVPNRLERSKQEIREMLDGLRGERVGILLFSGSAFLYCPLTLDIAAANLFLDAIQADVLPDPGTNLEVALSTAQNTLVNAEGRGGRAIVLFTDGEGHEGDPLPVARLLAEDAIPVLTIGVGTPAGEPIPVMDPSGRNTGYKKDRSGQVVLSRLDEDTLQRIAEVSGGTYFPATLQGHEIGEVIDFLGRMERGELGGSLRRRVEERFQIPAGVAAVFLLLALILPEARGGARREPGLREP
ncbi:MAG TPA: VWA domain-containing protein [Candidatus Eisenbacteria bacterium]|nr:VWA domain-containing protein [Candidatus Eisenbacteria bacterium]